MSDYNLLCTDQNAVTATQPAVTTTVVSTVTTTAAYSSTSTSSAITCGVPTAAYRLVILPTGAPGYQETYLTTANGLGTPSGDHAYMTTTTNVTVSASFNPVANGQAYLIAPGNLAVYSDQSTATAGNDIIYFDSNSGTSSAPGGAPPSYGGTTREAVQFCLQNDNTFIVRNTDGATTVCQNTDEHIYLYSATNAAANPGCVAITLRLEYPSAQLT